MKRLFYGWKMVAAGTGIQFLQSFLLQQSFGAYFAVLRDDRGWSKTALSGVAALQQVEAALLGPIMGWFLDRFGPRGVIRTGIVIFGAGFMLLAFTESLLAFYAAFFVIAIGSSLSSYIPLNVALLHWFERRRARALSTLHLGLAFGGTAVPLIAWSLVTWGWRVTAFASGVFVIAAGWPLASVIRNRPSDVGTTVDGEPAPPPQTAPSAALAAAAGEPPPRDFTAREALRTPAFWLISLGHGFALFVVTAVNVHAVTHMKEALGYSLEAAAFVITLMTFSQIGGVAIGWSVGDRWDKRLIAAGCMLAHMVALLALTFAASTALPVVAMLVVFAVLHGAAWGLRGPLMQAIRADYFGTRAIGMILGLSSMIVVIGQIGGPLIAGALADATGNYRAGFTLLALLAGAGSAFFLLARRPRRMADSAA